MAETISIPDRTTTDTERKECTSIPLIHQVALHKDAFDEGISYFLQGLCPDHNTLRMMGFQEEIIPVSDQPIDLFHYPLTDIAECYKKIKDISSLQQSDYYDFWLLSLCSFLMKKNTVKDETLLQEHNNNLNAIAHKYQLAISQAILREYYPTKSHTVISHFPEIQSESDAILQSYLSILEGNAPINTLGELSERLYTLRNKCKEHNTNMNNKAVIPFDDNPGWSRALDLIHELNKEVHLISLDPTYRSQRIITIIDTINNTLHNNDGIAIDATDCSDKRQIITALCESMMQNNIHYIFSEASTHVKNLFRSCGGDEMLINQPTQPRGSTAYIENFTSIMQTMFDRIAPGEDHKKLMLLRKIVHEFIERYGLSDGYKMLLHIVNQLYETEEPTKKHEAITMLKTKYRQYEKIHAYKQQNSKEHALDRPPVYLPVSNKYREAASAYEVYEESLATIKRLITKLESKDVLIQPKCFVYGSTVSEIGSFNPESDIDIVIIYDEYNDYYKLDQMEAFDTTNAELAVLETLTRKPPSSIYSWYNPAESDDSPHLIHAKINLPYQEFQTLSHMTVTTMSKKDYNTLLNYSSKKNRKGIRKAIQVLSNNEQLDYHTGLKAVELLLLLQDEQIADTLNDILRLRYLSTREGDILPQVADTILLPARQYLPEEEKYLFNLLMSQIQQNHINQECVGELLTKLTAAVEKGMDYKYSKFLRSSVHSHKLGLNWLQVANQTGMQEI